MLLPALFAGFSLVAMVLLHLGLYRPALVLPLGLTGAAVAALGVGLVRPEPMAGSRLLDGAAVLVTLGFAALNVRYSAQNISVFRDPAAYAVTGQWLVHHGSLPIPVNAEVFGAVPGVRFALVRPSIRAPLQGSSIRSTATCCRGCSPWAAGCTARACC